MPADPIDYDPTSLPRELRGYDRQATEELFRQVKWKYGLLAGEHRKLRKAMDELTEGQPASNSSPPRPVGSLDEVARSLLTGAHKAARELRESTREECEATLKKARERARLIEAEAELAAAGAMAVKTAAAALRDRLRATLEQLERTPDWLPVAPNEHTESLPRGNGVAQRDVTIR